MNKIIRGIGVIKEGVYEKIVVSGSAAARGAVTAKALEIHGTWEGKSLDGVSVIDVSGIARLGSLEFAKKLTVKGAVLMKRSPAGAFLVTGEGIVDAETLECEKLSLAGACHMKELSAEEISITKSKKLRPEKANRSKVGSIRCQKLTAYALTAQTVVAEEVHLFGACEIDTLIADHVEIHDPTCIVRHHVSKV